MPKIHIILQGKGGVGKSFVAALLTQYKINKGQAVTCIDTDPVNKTFFGYKKLPVTQLDIMEQDQINARKFDQLIETIASNQNDIIIDNGASSFIPLSHYLLSNEIPHLLQEMDRELVIHSVITGGQALIDTVNGCSHLLSHFPENTPFIVWLNPFWGEIRHNGKSFDEMKVYLNNKKRILAIIKIPQLKHETYGYDLGTLLKKRLTFDEALDMDSFSIMARQRLKIIKRELFLQLDNSLVL